ncbi:MAG TPA: hypothetical protein VE465_05880 [Streptosporangiaceae bacterium]|jgi:hypothetical protein|nr:hypothetical protein [Streptosporangiaceae bacterium]
MIITLLSAALLGGLIGGAELVACYRDRPAQAVFSPSGLMYVFVNAVAALITLVAVETTGFQFGLPDAAPLVSLYVVQVATAGLGSAALMRTSFTLAHDRGTTMGPISLLHGLLKVVDAAMARKRALSRLSGNKLDGLSFARDHAALAQLACHALPRFDLAEAQRLGELAADLCARDDLTDADKLDCFALELSWLVGERALAKAAARLRSRPNPADEAGEPADTGLLAEPRAAHAAMAVRQAQETRHAERTLGRPEPGDEAGGRPGKTGTNASRSVLETRADMRRQVEAAEPRPAGSPLAGRSLRRSRTAS